MFSATSLLVLACACAVSAINQSCEGVAIGSATDQQVQLDLVRVYERKTDVHISYVCVNGESGASAETCDDAMPTTYFQDPLNLIVERTGSLDGYATVNITVYCN